MASGLLYEDGTRLDFQITALAPSASENLDNGYRIICRNLRSS